MRYTTLEEYLISRERKIINTRKKRSLDYIEDCNPLDEDFHDNLFNFSEYDNENSSN